MKCPACLLPKRLPAGAPSTVCDGCIVQLKLAATESDDIRALGWPDAEPMTDLVVAAFDDDPGIQFIFATSASRQRWLRSFQSILADLTLNWGLPTGIREATGAPLSAIALWHLPNRRFPPPWYSGLRPAFELMLPMLLLDPFCALRLESTGRAYRQFFPKQRTLFLSGLAVSETRRRQGLGRRLLEWGFEYATHEGCPLALTCWSNLVPYYERLGFRVDGELAVRGIEPALYRMVWTAPRLSSRADRNTLKTQPEVALLRLAPPC